MVMVTLPENTSMTLVGKIKYANGEYLTINYMLRVTSSEFERALKYFTIGLNLKDDDYYKDVVEEIIFSYILTTSPKPKESIFNVNRKQIVTPATKFRGVALPSTMEFSK